MSRFTAHNTDHQYNNSELAELNAVFEDIVSFNHDADHDSAEYKSWEDFVSETLLSRYALGERGDSLLR